MADSWMLRRGGRDYGPFTSEQLLKMAADGSLGAADQLQKNGLGEWCPLAACAAEILLQPAAASPPPPQSPPPPPPTTTRRRSEVPEIAAAPLSWASLPHSERLKSHLALWIGLSLGLAVPLMVVAGAAVYVVQQRGLLTWREKIADRGVPLRDDDLPRKK